MNYRDVADHREMVFDSVRNAAYETAMAALITPDTVVADVGAGLGVLGLIAARLGARRVHLIEPEPVLRIAGEVAAASGLTDRIELHNSTVEDAELGERVDLLVSVMTGNAVMGENLLPVLVDARRKFLTADGKMLPSATRLWAAPVSAQELHSDHVGAWSASPHGLDFSAARQFAANTVVTTRGRQGVVMLAEPTIVAAMDLRTVTDPGIDGQISVVAETAGTFHGWLAWHDLELGERWLDTGPRYAPTHWRPVFFPVDQSVEVEPGQRLELSLKRPVNRPWTWQTTTADGREIHSNLFSRPLR